MRTRYRSAAGACLALICLSQSPLAAAHGFAGERFFPATLATEDPFVSDELSLPTISTIREPANGDEPSARETALSIEYSKRITPRFGLGFGEEYAIVNPRGEPSRGGFGNLELSAKYEAYRSDVHEALLAVGLEAEIGGTGAQQVEAESFSVLTPAVFFGKGFGDLPERLPFLRPFAVTGVVGMSFPTRSSVTNEDGAAERNPHVLSTGVALQYNLQYLQSHVRDVGLPAPFKRMIPLVELALDTSLDRGASGRTIGTVNPGVLWFGRHFQLGVEANIPVNGHTGNSVGVTVQLHLFLDDLFPGSLGRPVFQ